MGITHAAVATGNPLIEAGDWNAAHIGAPTLAEVLVAGNDPGTGIDAAMQGATGSAGTGGAAFTSTSTAQRAGDAALVGGDGVAGKEGGAAGIYAGAGNGATSVGAQVQASGGLGDGTGGPIDIFTGDAGSSSGKQGGDLTFTPGVGDGAGRGGLVFLNLPTSDPGVSGALYVDGMDGNRVKVSA